MTTLKPFKINEKNFIGGDDIIITLKPESLDAYQGKITGISINANVFEDEAQDIPISVKVIDEPSEDEPGEEEDPQEDPDEKELPYFECPELENEINQLTEQRYDIISAGFGDVFSECQKINEKCENIM